MRVRLFEAKQLGVCRRVDHGAREAGRHPGNVHVGDEDHEDCQNEDDAEYPAVDL